MDDFFTYLVAVVGLFSTVSVPMLKLNTTLNKLNSRIDKVELKIDIDNQTLQKFLAENKESHRRIHERIDGTEDRLDRIERVVPIDQ